MESSCCSALQEKCVLPPAFKSEKCVSLSGRESTDKSVVLLKREPPSQSAHWLIQTHILLGVTFNVFFSPLLDHLHGGIPRTALCASATQPRTCQDAAMSERVICRNVEVEAEMSGTRSPLRASVRAVSSATGVGNKVRLLHGYHTFPNPLQT